MFLMWYDDDKRKSACEKIGDALAAYERRFHLHANVVLVHTSAAGVAPEPVAVRPLAYIQPSMFYVGVEEMAR